MYFCVLVFLLALRMIERILFLFLELEIIIISSDLYVFCHWIKNWLYFSNEFKIEFDFSLYFDARYKLKRQTEYWCEPGIFFLFYSSFASKCLFDWTKCDGEKCSGSLSPDRPMNEREKKRMKRKQHQPVLLSEQKSFILASKRPLSQVDCTITHRKRSTSSIQLTNIQSSHLAYLIPLA